MLKSIVNGAEHDIVSIPMKGKNLSSFDAITYLNDDSYYVSYRILNSIPEGSYTLSYFVDVDPSVDSLAASIGVGSTIYEKDIKIVNSIDPGYINIPFSITDADAGKNLFVRFVRSGSKFTATITVTKVMLNTGSTALPYEPYGYQNGWEVRDNQNRLIWGREDELQTTTGTLPFKGYGLDIKEYSIDGNMVQAAEKEYSITGTSPLDFQSNGSNATISISGNETQASNQSYTTSCTSPLSFNADGTNLTALSMDGNMNQASSQPYTVSGTSPISFMNNGTAIDYTVSGNMSQSGTPTPTSPITPQECGERTNQLIPYPYYSADGVYDGITFTTDGNKIVANGTTSTGYNFYLWRVDKFPAGTYTLSVTGTHTGASIYVRDVTNSTTIVGIFGGQTGDRQISFTTTEELQVYVYINSSGTGTVDFDCSIMLNEGSTALPYEPNLYKVPLTIAGNTQNIYIKEPLRKIGDYSDTVNSDGSVTRVIKKIVLTGAESEWSSVGGQAPFLLTISGYSEISKSVPYYMSSHFKPIAYDDLWGTNDNFIVTYQTGFRFKYSTLGTDLNDFKTWLSTQYENNNPITVWYALQIPQTDTATVPTITPTSGNNTLSVDTTLAPSNITVTSNSSVFPENPITPIECGVLSENLFDNNQTTTNENGAERPGVELPVGTYSIYNTSGQAVYYRIGDSGTGAQVNNGNSKANIVANDTLYVWQYPKKDGVMVIEGATAPTEYEPYGKYKIPVTVGSTTKNIFINQPLRKIGNYSDSIGSDGVVTRNIKKLVLDGTENWSSYSEVVYLQDIIDYAKIDNIICMCTHYEPQTNVDGVAETDTGHIAFGKSSNYRLNIHDANINNATDYKLFLADEYSAGHPVEVWYILATPDTTETTTIPTISTVNGANTLTTGTPITPSNITISTSSSVYPKNPIYPEECGDRTGNVLDLDAYLKRDNNGYTKSGSTYTIPMQASLFANPWYFSNEDVPISISGTMQTLTGTNIRIYIVKRDGAVSGSIALGGTGNVTKTENRLGAGIKFDYTSIGTCTVSNLMVNFGSTALPYEPYGYKIPVTIGSNTNYIYTKEPIRKIGNYADVVNSDGSITRYIKKIELNGTENIILGSPQSGGNVFSITDQDTITSNGSYSISNYYRNVYGNSGEYTYIYNGRIILLDKSHSTVTSFKQWLSDEYNSGNPVCVWYVMQTPTAEQTTIPTLTTVNGTNTATIGTTLAPSSITINATSKVYPNNPIIPEFCGVRTENLIDATMYDNLAKSVAYLSMLVSVPIVTLTSPEGLYTRVVWTQSMNPDTRIHESNWITSGNSATFDLASYSDADCFKIEFRNVEYSILTDEDIARRFNIMLNTGSTALPYEPYGYKISFNNNGENLFDCDRTDGIIDNSYIRKSDSEIVTDTDYYISYPIYVSENVTYTWRFDSDTSTTHSAPTVGFYDSLDNMIGTAPHGNGLTYFSFTTPNGCKYIRASVYKHNNFQREAMLNLGSTPLPYSPYLNKTTPIYLSEVPTIRRIKKLVLTGDGEYQNYSYDGTNGVRILNMLKTTYKRADGLCNICKVSTVAGIRHCLWIGSGGGDPHLYFISILSDMGLSDASEFKSWVAQQYQNGTPVTIWYALANPETGIVNEPLAKIGNYADELTEISVHNLSAPLYGIGDYKDILNLSTGVLTRKIRKLVLDGVNDGEWKKSSTRTGSFYLNVGVNAITSLGLCDRAVNVDTISQYDSIGKMFVESSGSSKLINLWLFDTNISLDDFKAFLAAQYANGTPVTVWYVLNTPKTETVTVPTGMTGEIEGYLTQISTPTPEHPSIPKWNGKEETGGTYAVTVYDLPEIPTTTGKNTLTVDTTLAPYDVTINGHIRYTYWGKIREDVRSGLAQTKFPVGTILYDNEDATTGRAFQVVGYDKHFDPSLTARGFTHSMTLCQLKLSGPWQYDAIEAFLYTTVEMQPGTYKFKIPNYDTTYGGNKTYYFTSTATVPVDSQIVLKWDYQKPPASVTAYAGPNPQTNTTAITGFNALTLTEWVEGESPEAIDLGTIKLANNDPDSAYGKLNHIQRARYGSNNYYQSGLRQLLNTDLAANNWWHPATIFDRPYANRTTNGYLRSLNEDFINVLATPEITNITNNVFEYPSLDGRTFALNTEYKINTDKVFLLSHTEVGLSSSPNVGTVLDYYSTHNTNNDRIKYRIDNGNAYHWWFRTPYPSYAHDFRYCSTSGALDVSHALNYLCVAPAHIIQ